MKDHKKRTYLINRREHWEDYIVACMIQRCKKAAADNKAKDGSNMHVAQKCRDEEHAAYK